ncbi:metallophosphoesterase [Eubacteriales bacterium OttesenSCG-928-G02]|nr:metallophosphoesterase [Eubacteriales bacterium OttesenSCG-928-G02]
MIYLTGDTHGDFWRIEKFIFNHETSQNDIMIILGDAGINYYDDMRCEKLKAYLSRFPLTFLCVHGNHENRPQNILSYEESYWNGGIIYSEKEYPNLLFAKDGEIYDINGRSFVAIGGAYSIDKTWRIEKGYGWWEDEQPSELIKQEVEHSLKQVGNKVDVVLSHTCPYKYVPREKFLKRIVQSEVDNSTEQWLDAIEENLDYKKWYCGHYHTYKQIDKMHFLFEDIIELDIDI